MFTGVAIAQPALTPAAPSGPPAQIQTPQIAYRQPLTDSDAAALNAVLTAAKAGDGGRIRVLMAGLQDSTARKIALWALADTASDSMSFMEIDGARRDLAGWPRPAKRQAGAEKLLETAGLGPQGVIAWFGGGPPATPEGAMALASAYRATNQLQAATDLIRSVWRTKLFDADLQRTMLARFGDILTPADHAARLDALLYGPQGQAARDMIAIAPADQQVLAQARIAFRANAGNAPALFAALSPSLAADPGLTFERLAWYRRRGQEDVALTLVGGLPRTLPHEDAAARMWRERYALVLYALKNNNGAGAYAAAANSGLTTGADAAEAEFYAGWMALSRLRNPGLADQHFARIQQIGSSPITQSRALYWRGRAAEAAGDGVGAALYYAQGGRYVTTFYGQLAAGKAGLPIALGHDPDITTADRARFEGREPVRAARILAEIGARDTFKVFIAHLDDIMPTASEAALLVDLVRGYQDQDTAMRAVRAAAQRGIVLPERGYPIRNPPAGVFAPETALILGIIRQESGFDPRVRSAPGATGLMQLMPSTAVIVARGMGVPYSLNSLFDPDYNMRVGSRYLDQMVGTFGGSYVMAAAGYNAGPGRPASWVAQCGDPRGTNADALDFIECIPFSETRNYVMRVLEGMQVYRARLNGNTAPSTLGNDLKRGTYTYVTPPSDPRAPFAPSTTPAPLPPGSPGTMQPIPD